METQLYIPKRIKVGYQKREDTYTKKLAYIIYFDDKNVLRKETSWQSWRDSKIEPEEFDNIPQDGFILNKSIQRYRWSHFGTDRNYIRIYDPRGIEFEITPDNLLGILMTTNCNKRELEGKFVYAWSGKDLVLLPTDCEEYRASVSYTKLQAGKVGAKDLVAGCAYKTKRDGNVIYVGKYEWFKLDLYNQNNSRTGKKYYIFYQEDKNDQNHGFIVKSGLEFLSEKINDDIVYNFADIVEKFSKDPHSQQIKSVKLVPTTFDPTIKPEYNYHIYLKRDTYFLDDGDNFIQIHVQGKDDYNYTTNQRVNGYKYTTYFTFSKKEFKKVEQNKDCYYNTKTLSEKDMNDLKLHDLYLIYENGKEKKIKSLYDLN